MRTWQGYRWRVLRVAAAALLLGVVLAGQPSGVAGQSSGAVGQPSGAVDQSSGVAGQPSGVAGQSSGAGLPDGVSTVPRGAAGRAWAPSRLPALSLLPAVPHPGAPRPLPADHAWAWPVTGPQGVPVVVRFFDLPAERWLAGHRGVDLLAPPGTQVHAPTDAVVSFAGPVAGRGVLTLVTTSGLRLSFEPLETSLLPGDAVHRGDPVGAVAGPSHCSAGPPGRDSCLHWGVRGEGHYLNPLQFVWDLRPSVLLPPLAPRSPLRQWPRLP